MNAYETLRAHADAAATITRGQWQQIRLIPDPATGEILNVGVLYRADDGTSPHLRLLEDFTRLRCLYGERLDPEHLRFLFRVARSAWGQTDAPQSPSPQLILSAPRYAAGENPEQVVDELYADTVSLEPSPAIDTDEDRPDLVDTTKARRLIFDAMKLRSPFSAHLIADSPEWALSDDDSLQVLDMPLRASDRFGTVLSAWYLSRSSLELNMLRGVIDLDTALRLYPKDVGGLFIYRPPPEQRGFGAAKQQQIDNVIDMIAWRLRGPRMRLEVEDAPERLAEHVLDWAGMAA